MTIKEIAKLTGAELPENNLSAEIDNVTITPEDAEKGDLCFAENEEMLKIASKNGATAVVCSETLDFPAKSDICYLPVKDLPEAALKLAGYLAGEESVGVEFLDTKEVTYLKLILQHQKSIAFLPDTWESAFEMVMGSQKPLIVTDNRHYYNALRPKKVLFGEKVDGYVVSADSLFRTTFKIEKYIYQYRQFPHFHLGALQKAIALCEKYELPYRLDKINYTRHFKPIFLEGEPSVQEVMKNDKVVILSDNLEDILEARSYAANVGSWMAKTIVLVPPKTKVEGVKYPTYYQSDEEILELIGSLNYNYLFVYTDDKSLEEKIKKVYL